MLLVSCSLRLGRSCQLTLKQGQLLLELLHCISGSCGVCARCSSCLAQQMTLLQIDIVSSVHQVFDLKSLQLMPSGNVLNKLGSGSVRLSPIFGIWLIAFKSEPNFENITQRHTN